MRLIVNADDFGWNVDTVQATIDCFEAGVLTSATIMPSMPCASAAIDYARLHPEFSFGVHLTFVRYDTERPSSEPERIPQLVDADGRFLPAPIVRFRALTGRLEPRQIEHEIAAQISPVLDAGIAVSHVDSHAHIHKFRPFREALKRVLPRFGIRRVRLAQNLFCSFAPWRPTYWFGVRWGRLLRKSFATTEHFFMPGPADGDWVARLLAHKLPGILEVGLHPGYDEAWRDRERRAALELVHRGSEQGWKLTNWFHVTG